MVSWAFWGGFAAVAAVLVIGGLVARQKLRQFSRGVFGTADLAKVLHEASREEENRPRSLSGCDRLLLPDILRDFPDFDVTMAKTYAREYLQKELAHQGSIRIHNIVIARYLPSAAQKTIVFQAAIACRKGGKTVQRRYDLSYSYVHGSDDKTVAANCPNCGAVLGYGQTVCAYCGSRVVNVMGNTWEFTQLQES